MKPLPSTEQIQSWVLGIAPSEYFERLVTHPGILVLRAKDPVCVWRGLHLALSDQGTEQLREHLLRLASSTTSPVQLQCSLPDGRPWFELYTSGVDFGSWWKVEFESAEQLPPDLLSVRYVHSTVHIRLSAKAASTLAQELARPLQGGVRSSLALHREVRPSAEPQALWLWHWPAGCSAG